MKIINLPIQCFDEASKYIIDNKLQNAVLEFAYFGKPVGINKANLVVYELRTKYWWTNKSYIFRLVFHKFQKSINLGLLFLFIKILANKLSKYDNKSSKLLTILSKSDNLLIELFNDDSIMCLLKSIPYTEILENTTYTSYLRCNVGEVGTLKYEVTELPSMLVCKNGKVVKVISGYFEDKNKDKFFKLLKQYWQIHTICV